MHLVEGRVSDVSEARVVGPGRHLLLECALSSRLVREQRLRGIHGRWPAERRLNQEMKRPRGNGRAMEFLVPIRYKKNTIDMGPMISWRSGCTMSQCPTHTPLAPLL